MKYVTAAAFRQALEQRIQRESREQSLSHVRLRKLIVFDRFLAHLLAAAPEGWVLKGGVALTLRWERHARSTNDLDLGRQDTEEDATEHLVAAASLDLDDFLVFTVARTRKLDAMTEGATVRYHVTVELAGRRFDEITVDIGFGDPLALEPDLVPGTTLLEFAGIKRLAVPTVALEQHIAEKLHAYTRKYGSGTNTRVKDLVDLVLAERYATPYAGRLHLALNSIVASRGPGLIPDRLPPPPNDWAVAYHRIAHEVALSLDDGAAAMQLGYERASRFLKPVLDGTTPDGTRWDPATQQWVATEPPRSKV